MINYRKKKMFGEKLALRLLTSCRFMVPHILQRMPEARVYETDLDFRE